MTIRISTALLALALLSLPAAAQAAPATIRVFEAEVHAKPDRASPVIHTFAEDTRVSVSEEVVNGFRRVRLPDGKVGYVEDSALELAAGAATAPPGPPPEALPPPPPSAPPPPPPPPPPPYWTPYHPVRAYYDPFAHRHVGLFMRFDLGLGYLGASTSSAATQFDFDSAKGVAGEFGFALGGAVAENFIVGGHFWGSWAASQSLTFQGAPVPSSGSFNTSLTGFGPSFDWYLMPENVYFSVTPSLTWVNFSDLSGGFQTDAGFGTHFALGKEWWVAPHWAVGVSGWFALSFNHESGGGTWHTYTGGLGFSSTFN